jgi:hypothetical protein
VPAGPEPNMQHRHRHRHKMPNVQSRERRGGGGRERERDRVKGTGIRAWDFGSTDPTKPRGFRFQGLGLGFRLLDVKV